MRALNSPSQPEPTPDPLAHVEDVLDTAVQEAVDLVEELRARVVVEASVQHRGLIEPVLNRGRRRDPLSYLAAVPHHVDTGTDSRLKRGYRGTRGGLTLEGWLLMATTWMAGSEMVY